MITTDLTFKLLIKPSKNAGFIGSGGCGTNAMVYTHLLKFLQINNYKQCDTNPGFVILNTCVVSMDRINMCEKVLKEVEKKYPDSVVVIFGCYSGIKIPSSLRTIKIPARDLNTLDIHFKHSVKSADIKINISDVKKISNITSIDTDINRVLISHGCNYRCTFCNIKNSKGNTRSIPVATIINNIRDIISHSKKNVVTLISDDPGSYGTDTGTDISQLLHVIVKEFPDILLKIPALHPRSIIDHEAMFRDLISIKKIISLDVPIQSGSQRILKQMARPYDISKVIDIIKSFKRINPDIFISTQIIINSPGEEVGDLKMSMEAARVFNYVDFFEMSNHSNVPMATKATHAVNSTRMNLVKAMGKGMDMSITSTSAVERERNPSNVESHAPVWMGNGWFFDV